MALINKKGTIADDKEGGSEDEANINSSGNLAGTLCLVFWKFLESLIIDSSVTDHICNTDNMFKSLRDIDGSKYEVTISTQPDGSAQAQIDTRGS